MVLGNKTKKPLYTVKVESKIDPPSTHTISGAGIQPKMDTPQPAKPMVQVENMTLEQLITSYHKQDTDEEPMLPGFNYLKKMKHTIKSERVKSVLKR
jgi:hypothetical protein